MKRCQVSADARQNTAATEQRQYNTALEGTRSTGCDLSHHPQRARPLLLHSRSARFPHGLANDSGLVGRNLMFHIFSYVGFELPGPSMGALGPNGMMSIDDPHPSDASRGFIRGAVISEAAEPEPLWAAYKAPDYLGTTTGAWGKPLKDYLRRYPHLGALISTPRSYPLGWCGRVAMLLA